MEKKLSSLGRTIYSAGDNAKLDKIVKSLLSHKQILAYLLKYAVKEFEQYSIEEIIPMIDKVHTDSIGMEPGTSNNVITGEPQVSDVPGEGGIRYDIRFIATLPGNTEGAEYDLIINVEAQGKPNESYWLETRAIAYGGRLLSDQIGRNVVDSHYENLQKVYTIWICMNCPQKDANTISEYGIREVNRVGNYTGHPRIDLLGAIMIRLPKDDEWEKAKNPATNLTEMLATLLSNRIAPEKKVDDLENKYGIEATEEIIEEVNEMCNYSSVIATESETKANEATALRMIKAGKYGKEEISEMTGVSLKRVGELIRQEKEEKKNPVMA